MKIFLTGSTGFIGKNFKSNFGVRYKIRCYNRNDNLEINEDLVFHFAGIAHDLKNKINVNEYYKVNTELTKKIFDCFLKSDAIFFLYLSTVKAVSDDFGETLFESQQPNPKTHYGKSKLLAEKYILSKKIPKNKRVFILRPCMVHGPGNKGNLNLLHSLIVKGFPWPLGSYENKRSYCTLYNLFFVIDQLINDKKISSGIYNIADDEPLSTNQIVSMISSSKKIKLRILKIPKIFIKIVVVISDFFGLFLNKKNFNKLTGSYIVSNKKIINAIGKSLPYKSEEGIMNTIKSFE